MDYLEDTLNDRQPSANQESYQGFGQMPMIQPQGLPQHGPSTGRTKRPNYHFSRHGIETEQNPVQQLQQQQYQPPQAAPQQFSQPPMNPPPVQAPVYQTPQPVQVSYKQPRSQRVQAPPQNDWFPFNGSQVQPKYGVEQNRVPQANYNRPASSVQMSIEDPMARKRREREERIQRERIEMQAMQDPFSKLGGPDPKVVKHRENSPNARMIQVPQAPPQQMYHQQQHQQQYQVMQQPPMQQQNQQFVQQQPINQGIQPYIQEPEIETSMDKNIFHPQERPLGGGGPPSPSQKKITQFESDEQLNDRARKQAEQRAVLEEQIKEAKRRKEDEKRKLMEQDMREEQRIKAEIEAMNKQENDLKVKESRKIEAVSAFNAEQFEKRQQQKQEGLVQESHDVGGNPQRLHATNNPAQEQKAQGQAPLKHSTTAPGDINSHPQNQKRPPVMHSHSEFRPSVEQSYSGNPLVGNSLEFATPMYQSKDGPIDTRQPSQQSQRSQRRPASSALMNAGQQQLLQNMENNFKSELQRLQQEMLQQKQDFATHLRVMREDAQKNIDLRLQAQQQMKQTQQYQEKIRNSSNMTVIPPQQVQVPPQQQQQQVAPQPDKRQSIELANQQLQHERAQYQNTFQTVSAALAQSTNTKGMSIAQKAANLPYAIADAVTETVQKYNVKKQMAEDEKRKKEGPGEVHRQIGADVDAKYEEELKKLDLSNSIITETAFVPFDYTMSTAQATAQPPQHMQVKADPQHHQKVHNNYERSFEKSDNRGSQNPGKPLNRPASRDFEGLMQQANRERINPQTTLKDKSGGGEIDDLDPESKAMLDEIDNLNSAAQQSMAELQQNRMPVPISELPPMTLEQNHEDKWSQLLQQPAEPIVFAYGQVNRGGLQGGQLLEKSQRASSQNDFTGKTSPKASARDLYKETMNDLEIARIQGQMSEKDIETFKSRVSNPSVIMKPIDNLEQLSGLESYRGLQRLENSNVPEKLEDYKVPENENLQRSKKYQRELQDKELSDLYEQFKDVNTQVAGKEEAQKEKQEIQTELLKMRNLPPLDSILEQSNEHTINLTYGNTKANDMRKVSSQMEGTEHDLLNQLNNL